VDADHVRIRVNGEPADSRRLQPAHEFVGNFATPVRIDIEVVSRAYHVRRLTMLADVAMYPISSAVGMMLPPMSL
jgi:hypothetical protein